MATSKYNFNSYTYSETGMNQMLDTDWSKLDTELYTLSGTITTNSDHGNLSGLTDDDHSQYTKADGTRYFDTGWSGSIPTASGTMTVVSGVITNYA